MYANMNWKNDLEGLMKMVKEYNSKPYADRPNCWDYLSQSADITVSEMTDFGEALSRICIQAVPEWCRYYEEIDALDTAEIITVVNEYYDEFGLSDSEKVEQRPKNLDDSYKMDLAIKLIRFDYSTMDVNYREVNLDKPVLSKISI